MSITIPRIEKTVEFEYVEETSFGVFPIELTV